MKLVESGSSQQELELDSDVVAALAWARNLLKETDRPLSGASLALLEQASGLTTNQIFTANTMKLGAEAVRTFTDLVTRCARGEPLAYILGRASFWGREFIVNSNVLIPRGDSEVLVERVLEFVRDRKASPKIVDIGTGSGCLAITLALETKSIIEGWDISASALTVAQQNASNLGAAVSWKLLDIRSAEIGSPRFDIVISNPPYIASRLIESLDPSVRDWEPRLALDGGAQGSEFYECLAVRSKEILVKGGKIFWEIGYDQAALVQEILNRNSWENVRVFQDLAGNDRIVTANL